MSMDVQDFVAQERQRCIKFYEWYTMAHRMDPQGYPLSLNPGEWDEQMDVFKEGNS